jgi:hypothetical protein
MPGMVVPPDAGRLTARIAAVNAPLHLIRRLGRAMQGAWIWLSRRHHAAMAINEATAGCMGNGRDVHR